MKKAFILSIFVLSIIVSFGQSIVTENKLWHNFIFFYTHPYPTLRTEIIKFTNDTVIDSLTYKKVERYMDETGWVSYGYIREDASKKIFYKFNPLDTAWLLYDLNVQLHDTILVYGLTTYLGGYTGMVPMTLYVNLIDSMIIGEKYQKRINLGLYPEDSLSISVQWVDSTGSMGGMLHNDYVSLDTYFLLCYFEDEILKYHSPDWTSCYYPTAIQEKNDLTPIVKISPNPITSISTLTVDGIKDINSISIRFYNHLGKEVFCIYGEKRIEIYKSDFSSGIYFYCLTINHKNFKTGKIIIN